MQYNKEYVDLQDYQYFKNIYIEEKRDKTTFINYLRENGIQCLYHFTDKANLDFILQYGGLYSWKGLQARKIQPPKMGGNELSQVLDRLKGLEDYVRLSFTKHHPMLFKAQEDGRIQNPIFIEIDLEVIYWDDTLFSNKNATANDVNIGKTFSDLKCIDLDLIKKGKWVNEQEKALFQAEVLVQSHIPLKYFLNRSLLFKGVART